MRIDPGDGWPGDDLDGQFDDHPDAYPDVEPDIGSTGTELGLGYMSDGPQSSFDIPEPIGTAQDGQPGLIGDPADDVRFWHQQEAPNSCAVAAQEGVLEQVTGVPFTESHLATEAEALGWYRPAEGTPLSHVGDLLDAHGVHTSRGAVSLDQLVELAHRDVPVIVSVDSAELWSGVVPDASLDQAPYLVGGGANHVVVVTGFDFTDPAHPMVVLNDSGIPNGGGVRVDLGHFVDAWADSGNYAVFPDGAAPLPPPAGAESDLVAAVSAPSWEPVVGISWTVEGSTESGNPVEYSTSYGGHYDQKTGEEVTPK